ncbi:MAG: long-chain fatty acid--CoA ligase [Pseudomonadota bacterium]
MDEKIWHKAYDKGVPATLNFEDMTIPQILNKSAIQYPDAVSIIFMNCRMTYRQLKEHVDRLATALARLGVKKNSRVAIQLPNLPQMVIGYYAAQSLGAQVVATNPLYVPREIEHQWNDAGVSVAICADFLYEAKIKQLRNKMSVEHFVIASIPDYLRFPLNLLAPLKLKKADPVPLIAKVAAGPGIHFFKDLIKNTPANPPKVEFGMDHLAVLQYTGGTTGVAKGAMLTHANLSYNVQQARAWFPELAVGKEVFLAALPYFHSFGMTVSMNLPICVASAMVLMPNPRDISQMIKNISKYRVTMCPAVPAIFNGIINHPDVNKVDLTSVKGCFSGSAPLPIEVLERFESLTGGKIVEGFGLTETSPITHVNPLHGQRKIGSIGVPVPNTDSRVVDIEDGKTEMSVGKEGELIIKGPQVMKGYWNMEEETAGMIKDGWLYTGDLATVDEDGYFKIVGRKKDMIIAGGYNIYPDEIDNILMMHPSVLEAATIGVPDEKRGETVKSFVVLKLGEEVTSEELRNFCKEQLAAYKVPTQIEFRNELPKSPILKILRRDLRDHEMQARSVAQQ